MWDVTFVDIITAVISILALISSIFIGKKQVAISQLQTNMNNKVELYLLHQPIRIHDANNKVEDHDRPAIYIRNIGGNVVYLERYTFNDSEHSLGMEVLPPVSHYDGFHYIFLPTDKTQHVSFEIFFKDWQKNSWVTKGAADFQNHTWDVTYAPCKKIEK